MLTQKQFDLHSSNYNNLLLVGDFNSEMTHSILKDFCQLYLLNNFMKKPTCFKNHNTPKT